MDLAPGAFRPDPHGDLAVILPALDEEEAIGKVLAELPRERIRQLLVVDNGSSDRTAEVARAAGAEVVVEPERGYGAACLAGIAHLGPVEIVVFLDADHSDHPEDLPLLVGPIRRGEADFVVGCRMAAGPRVLLPQAYYGNRLACFLMRLVWGGTFTDLGPFRAIRRDVLLRLGMRDRNYGWTIEMQIRALERRIRAMEVPVRYRRRIGASKISGTARGTILAGSKILYTLLKHALLKGYRSLTGTGRPSSSTAT